MSFDYSIVTESSILFHFPPSGEDLFGEVKLKAVSAFSQNYARTESKIPQRSMSKSMHIYALYFKKCLFLN